MQVLCLDLSDRNSFAGALTTIWQNLIYSSELTKFWLGEDRMNASKSDLR